MHTLSDKDKTILTLKYGMHIGNAASYICEFRDVFCHSTSSFATGKARNRLNKLLYDNNVLCAIYYFEDRWVVLEHYATYDKALEITELFKCVR